MGGEKIAHGLIYNIYEQHANWVKKVSENVIPIEPKNYTSGQSLREVQDWKVGMYFDRNPLLVTLHFNVHKMCIYTDRTDKFVRAKMM